MIDSLVNILHLTGEEKNLLGIETKAKVNIESEKPQNTEEVSLFDKFTNFLSGLNS